MKLDGKIPTPSSSWFVGRGGAAYRLMPGETAPAEAAKIGAPLVGRVRAETTCSACGMTGHNARNRKKCPKLATRKT